MPELTPGERGRGQRLADGIHLRYRERCLIPGCTYRVRASTENAIRDYLTGHRRRHHDYYQTPTTTQGRQ